MVTVPDGKAILHARLRRGWTLRDVAERCAGLGFTLSDSNLSKYERGVVKPSPKTLLAIARALDVTVDDLLTDAAPEPEGAS